MNKQEFLSALEERLGGLPREDIRERLDFYTEMIDDRMEDGLSEAEAVAAVGPVDAVVEQILADIPVTRLVKQRVTPKKGLRWWEITLLAVGSPLWLTLLLAAFAVVLALYAVLWSLVACLWAVFAALTLSAVGGVAAGAVGMVMGQTLGGLVIIAAALVCGGLGIFLFFGCKAATLGTARLTKTIALAIKRGLVRKEAST